MSATKDPTWSQITTQTAPGPEQDDEPFDLARLKKMFDDARTILAESRIDAEVSRDYYDGPGQLSPAMLRALRERGQPEIWINRVRGAVDGVIGVIDSNKVDPRAYPREPSDQDASDVASDTLRYTSEQSHFNVIKADCLENGLIEGCYAAIIEGGPDQDVTVTQVRWDEFFYDPRSRLPNFHDARYLGIAKWMYADQLSQIFPEKEREFGSFAATGDVTGLAPGGTDITWADKPENGLVAWLDSTRRRVMVVEVYHQDKGVWLRSVFCAVGVLEHGVSPYNDDRGTPRCAIIAGSCYVSRENTRYGIVRDMRPIQDEVNMRRQKLLHELNVRQVQQQSLDAPPVNVNTVRAEAARPDGVLPVGWQVVERRDIVEGQAQLLAEAKAEIERMGPNPAILGRQEAGASGRADQIRQAAGMQELQRVLGRFADWELRCYKAMWAVQRQFWSAPKWIRTTGDEQAPKYVQINEVVQPGVPAINPQTGQPTTDQQGNPIWAHPPVIKNHVAEMDIDIIIDTVPDTASLEQEVWQELIRLMGANPKYAQQVPFKLAIEMSPLPRKKQLLDLLAQAAADSAPQQQAQEHLIAQKAMSEQAAREAKAFKDFADGKSALISGVAQAAAAHMDITQAEIAEAHLAAGLPGATGAVPVAPVPAPLPPLQNQQPQQ